MFENGLENKRDITIFSLHDSKDDAKENIYFPSELFRGFSANRFTFIRSAIQKSIDCEIVILSHINLLIIGWMIKKISPHTRVYIFAHGIEIGNISIRKRKMFACCDKIICVSRFTLERIIQMHSIEKQKLEVLNNCLDPFLPAPATTKEILDLREKYGFGENELILFTLARLAAKERYKGYDTVIHTLTALKKNYPLIRYVIGGKYDLEEKKYLDELITETGLQENVFITGFIDEKDLPAWYAAADIFVMPSREEGFGLVFIEAMYYGLPVIAGNRDGSADALCNGELGLLVDPLNREEITAAILQIAGNKSAFIPDREKLLLNFGYQPYRRKLETILFGSTTVQAESIVSMA